ncbi:hypothetical protein MPTK1_8g17390 [Marchantia polymorpha subsp. ruderalis]|uniref:Uncharacterized protein n=1 Tax=Marchantia polymorpha TaxID=3197 RepID=A0A2R6X899_MARPO|nr:hypothetical protein MARPO_0030s0073 [Marchantia polymorpha]BBN20213.1 hypothetical protein Mp_8g17390 [Marchantia polymorpha subsp. ruderalis]|eukprot:PTQ42331.1 hypothetical protein MARPO_0030s0073 [Marchantia polymorpha]
MATLVNKARTKAVQIHHKGAKEGVKVKLEGVGTALKDVPTQGIKQNGYIITPSGANVGENISINGGGLVIRARNDKTQTITATSTPDNQLQVQVGQGKSAVQLSIQVTPQGSRGEVELQCVRNSQDKGATTGYTVSVSRPEEESRSLKQNRGTRSPRSQSPPDRRAVSPDRGRTTPERRYCSPARSRKSPDTSRFNSAAYQSHSPYACEDEACALKDETPETIPHERPRSSHAQTRRREQAPAQKPAPKPPSVKAPNQSRGSEMANVEDNDDYLLYKRKLDTHHHKPTISYLIARRMTELFKEMRKTAEMHPPPPFVKF